MNKWQQNMANKNGRRVRKLMRPGRNCQCWIGSGVTRAEGGDEPYLTLTVCGVNREERGREGATFSSTSAGNMSMCKVFCVIS